MAGDASPSRVPPCQICRKYFASTNCMVCQTAICLSCNIPHFEDFVGRYRNSGAYTRGGQSMRIDMRIVDRCDRCAQRYGSTCEREVVEEGGSEDLGPVECFACEEHDASVNCTSCSRPICLHCNRPRLMGVYPHSDQMCRVDLCAACNVPSPIIAGLPVKTWRTCAIM